MQRSLEVAEEIQQNLPPAQPLELPGLEIFGMALFSDKTGGERIAISSLQKLIFPLNNSAEIAIRMLRLYFNYSVFLGMLPPPLPKPF